MAGVSRRKSIVAKFLFPGPERNNVFPARGSRRTRIPFVGPSVPVDDL